MSDDQKPKSVKIDPNPFVVALARMSAGIGRDVGLLALRAVAGAREGGGAILVWDGEVPDSVELQLPFGKTTTLAAIIPPGRGIPTWLLDRFAGAGGEVIKKENADGSWLIALALDKKAAGE